MGQVEVALVIFAFIISVGFFANFIFQKTKFPDIIWLLFVGLLLGPIASIYGYDLVSREALSAIAPVFSAIALMIILFEGGLGMDIYKLIKEAPMSLKFSGMVIMFSSLVAGLLMYAYSLIVGLGIGFITSIILGFIVSGTSSAIVVPTMAKLKGVKDKVSTILSLESIITDPFVIIISLVLIQTVVAQTSAYVTVFGDIFSSFAVSIVMGIVAGLLWAKILPRLNRYEYHHMLTLAFIFLLYTLGETTGASGAIVSFVIGVILGNSKKIMNALKIKDMVGLTHQTRRFNSLISFFIRTFFFVFIGTLVTFENPSLFVIGIVLSFILLGARYLVIKLISAKAKFEARDRHIMLYMYPRGLAAAVMASLPFTMGIPGTEIFNEIVFSVILTTIVISTFGVMVVDRKYPLKEKIL